jgi:hypothetical protein
MGDVDRLARLVVEAGERVGGLNEGILHAGEVALLSEPGGGRNGRLLLVCLTWRWAYYIQLILAVPLAASFLCFSFDYTDVHKAIHEQEASLNRVRGNITGGTNDLPALRAFLE